MNTRIHRLASLLRTLTAGLAERTPALLKKYPKITPEEINKLATIDPTAPNYKYLDWIVGQYLKMPNSFFKDYTEYFVRDALVAFDKIKKQPLLLEYFQINPDISRISLEKLFFFFFKSKGINLDELLAELRSPISDKVKAVYNKPPYKILQVGGPDIDNEVSVKILMQLGDSTNWCTRHEKQASNYLTHGSVYVIFRDGVKYAQTDGNELKNIDNKTIAPDLDSDLDLYILLYQLNILHQDSFLTSNFNHSICRDHLTFSKEKIEMFIKSPYLIGFVLHIAEYSYNDNNKALCRSALEQNRNVVFSLLLNNNNMLKEREILRNFMRIFGDLSLTEQQQLVEKGDIKAVLLYWTNSNYIKKRYDGGFERWELAEPRIMNSEFKEFYLQDLNSHFKIQVKQQYGIR